MEISVARELFVFFSSLLGGVLIGFLFDLFRIYRKIIKTGVIMTRIQDILFWILATISIFLVILYSNSGELRWYEFVAIAMGIVFYNLLLSRIFISTLMGILKFLGRIIKFILKIVLFPLVLIYKLIKRPLNLLKKKVRNIFIKIKLTMKGICFKMKYSIGNVKKIIKKN